MNQKKKPTTHVTAVPEHASIKSRQQPNTRRTQKFLLIWLDASIDEVKNKECIKTISKLQEIVDKVHTFTNVDQCINFINGIDEEKTFMISSGAFGQTAVPIVHDKSQVNSIYIFCGNKSRHEQWAREWPKIKGVFTEIKPICEALKNAIQEGDQNTVSMSFVGSSSDAICEPLKTAVQEDNQHTISSGFVAPSTGIKIQNSDQLDPSFMYIKVLKEILLEVNFEKEHFMEFVTYCQSVYCDNANELNVIQELEQKYRQHSPIWWYTRESFLYATINRALRTMEVDIIIKSGFYICDLHRQIAQLHSEQFGEHYHSGPFTVYRGQGLSRTDFDRLLKSIGGLFSFNSFLSTQKHRSISLKFAHHSLTNPDIMGILFVMTIDPSKSSIPFADLHGNSYFDEQEVLFSMNSIFRIGKIKQINENNRLWQVEVSLTDDKDPQLFALTECVRKETFPDEQPWYRLGELLIKMGQFYTAEHVYELLLHQTVDTREIASIYHQLRRIKEYQGEYEHAIMLSEKALRIQQQTLSSSHPDLAISYNNISSTYEKMGEYSKALSSHEKALEIQQKSLPPNHPDLTMTYNKIGSIYEKMGEYSKALSCDEKALEIQQKDIHPNHSSLTISYRNIGSVYEKMGDYSKALSSYEKALGIQQQNLPQNHPDLAISYNNIGSVYQKTGDYSKALSYNEKALEIKQTSLPPNHPDLAISFNSIGSVYESMGQYSKALSYDEKALEIQQKSLPAHHPDLAISYNSIGSVYESMGQYSKALSYDEKALEIQQKSLPPNHPDLAMTYNNIGSVYEKMGEYMNALSSQGKAFKIFQLALPSNHPDLATSYNIMGKVLNVTGEYPKALSAHEKALEIQKQSLPPNHPNLATSYHNIGQVYINMGNYSKAYSFYEHALDVGQRALPSNHPSLQTYQKDIEILKKKM